MAVAVDNTSLNALMLILGDASFTTYDSSYCMQVMLEFRQSVIFRNPAYSSSGINPWLFYRGQVHVAPTNPDYTLLEAEPDGFSFSAHRFTRHWDPSQPPQVWLNGVLKTITTDYTVDYVNGRVTFLTAISDWQTVNASFVTYKIYHAAQQILLSALAGSQGVMSVEQGDIKYDYGDLRAKLKVVQSIIGNNVPSNLRINRKMY